MKLGDLLRGLGPEVPEGLESAEVSLVTNDSRKVIPGAVFVAVAGFREDGLAYAQAALDAGALLVIAGREAGLPGGRVTVNPGGDGRRLLAALSARFYGEPWLELSTVGITGTNGKTSTAHMTAWILRSAGRSCGILGTVGHTVGGRSLPAVETTPDSVDVAGLMRSMVEAGDTDCAMEVSSHALALSRVEEVRFDAVVFTNITRDHLDFHGTMEEYLAAKTRIFGLLKPGGRAFVGTCSPGVPVPPGALTFGRSPGDDIRISLERVGLDGCAYLVSCGGRECEVSLPVPGRVNICNSAGAIAACTSLGLSLAECCEGLATFPGVPGRLEVVDAGQPFLVAVDYAHTPDALERLLLQAREMTKARVIVVFGAGGDRDRTKRPLMGGIASRNSDLAVVTSDNPRTEDPGAIIDDILEGVVAGARLIVEPDRRRAIETAILAAGPGDVVIIAGKGHEDYQILGRERIRFDDREEARAVLGRLR